jgi:CDP-glucose 4,6-dehydratase
VRGFDLSARGCLAVHGLAGRLPVIHGNVLDLLAVERAIKNYDIEVCFHLAGQALIQDAAADPLTAFEVNVRGTWIVLEVCRRADSIKGVLCASSNHIYGPQREFPFTEDQPLNQLDIYGASKACIDILTRSYAYNYGLPAVAIRNVNSFGPGDPHK